MKRKLPVLVLRGRRVSNDPLLPGKVVIERKSQPGFTRVSQTLNQLSNMADHPDVLELSAARVPALQ